MKLPKPLKRGNAYRIEIMLNGKRYSCTRDTAKECQQWAMSKIVELQIEKQHAEQGIKPHLSFYSLFTDYYEKVGRYKGSQKWILSQYKSFKRKFDELSEKSIHDITPKDLTKWRNNRLKEVSAKTVLREIALFSAVFTYAQKELFLIDVNPFIGISKPETPEARHRRISDKEIELILKAFDYEQIKQPTQAMHYVAWAFLFAIETAMRRGEILNMKSSDIFDGYVHLPKTKNGTKRNVPLSPRAKELISVLGDFEPMSENAFRLSWQRGLKRSGIDDLHFHDTRHEAISRMVKVKKLPVEILAKITGHKKIEVLINTYYNPDADELVEMFNQ